MQLDAVRAIEACYAPAADEAAWLRNLAATLQPLARGAPTIAATHRIQNGRYRLTRMIGTSPDPVPSVFSVYKDRWENADPETVALWFSPMPPVGMASHRLARTPPEARGWIRALYRSAGFQDALGVLALEPDGRGVLLCVGYGEPVRLPPQTLHQLGRVTAHLGTALRLRSRGMLSSGPDRSDVEAILDLDGKLHHATGVARDTSSREALRSAVQAVERARGRLRRASPDEAIASWQGLVEGRWSLIDHGESDGRRFVLARRNEPEVRDVKALLPRERQVLAFAALGHSNKHIGYALGVAPNTVATHLSTAMAKLGLRSRRELIDMFGPMARSAE